jgi:hypothetical protein
MSSCVLDTNVDLSIEIRDLLLALLIMNYLPKMIIFLWVGRCYGRKAIGREIKRSTIAVPVVLNYESLI